MNALSHKKMRENARNGGFSLVEVAIALAIFIIGAVALLRIFPGGLNVLENSGNRRSGHHIANSSLDRFANQPIDAIYDGDYDSTSSNVNRFAWNDYEGALLGDKRAVNAATRKRINLPNNPNDFDDSALGRLRCINGETQRVNSGRVVTSFVVDGQRVEVARERQVSGVTIGADGEMDFANAVSGGIPFREATLPVQNAVSEGAFVVLPFNSGFDAAPFNASLQFQIEFITPLSPPFNLATANVATPDDLLLSGTLATSSDGISLVLPVQARSDSLNESDEYFWIRVQSAQGISAQRERILVRIPGPAAPPAGFSTPSNTSNEFKIRPPLSMRVSGGRPNTYFASYDWEWSNGARGGARLEPMCFVKSFDGLSVGSDANFPQSLKNAPTLTAPLASNFPVRALFSPFQVATFNCTQNHTLKVRQFLGLANGVSHGVLVDVSGLAANGETVKLNYSARDWRYISQRTQTSEVPFPGPAPLPGATPTTPSDPADAFNILADAFGISQNRAASEIRMIRTPSGFLQGPVYVVVNPQVGAPHAITIDDRVGLTLDSNPSGTPRPTPNPNTAQGRRQALNARQFLKTAFKEGRIYVDTRGVSAVNYQINYRTKTGWAEQIGVVAARYVPFVAPSSAFSVQNLNYQPMREAWREYVQFNGKLYFHPAEAGKTIWVQTSSERDSNSARQLSDRAQPIPAGFPVGFAGASAQVVTWKESATVGDVFAVSAPDTWNDVPGEENRVLATGDRDTGFVGRVLWENGSTYSQELAR